MTCALAIEQGRHLVFDKERKFGSHMPMKILFTLFTPPFAQMQSSLFKGGDSVERKYLKYDDWFSNLRKNCVAGNEVKLVSLTKQKEPFSITRDGYEAVFFPVANPDEPVKDGRWDFYAPGLVEWVNGYAPDVVHAIGTGHRMAAEIMKAGFGPRTCLWERMKTADYKFGWDEYALCARLVMPTAEAAREANARLKENKAMNLPLGANVELFRPDASVEKKFDIISVGFTQNKRGPLIREIAKRHRLSWLLAGGINKGWPFTPRENLLFMNSMRKRLGLPRVKKARAYPHVCGFFSNTEMPALYNSARVLVHPAVEEGAPRCVQEALACEVPVVVLKSTVPYVDADFGIPCESPDEIDGAVAGLLADEERRREMGRRGREWLVKNHGPDKLHEAVERLNIEIVGK